MSFSLSKKSRANLSGVHPRLIEVVELAIVLTVQDFSVGGGARTAAEQNALYQQGRSKPGKIVTHKDGHKHKSNHQITADGTGHAVDLVPFANGAMRWDWPLIYPVAEAMQEAASQLGVELRWGGVWDRSLAELACSSAGLEAAVHAYTKRHAGPDFIDGPHYEFLGEAAPAAVKAAAAKRSLWAAIVTFLTALFGGKS
ncbi:MAG: M15 family metallopeptidase [Rhodobacteraceae bacterium]|nr:M15 family metallopeptidase [Paracoccaceae bacterium]